MQNSGTERWPQNDVKGMTGDVNKQFVAKSLISIQKLTIVVESELVYIQMGTLFVYLVKLKGKLLLTFCSIGCVHCVGASQKNSFSIGFFICIAVGCECAFNLSSFCDFMPCNILQVTWVVTGNLVDITCQYISAWAWRTEKKHFAYASKEVTLESLSSLMDMNVIVKNKGYECDGLSRGHKLKANKEMMCWWKAQKWYLYQVLRWHFLIKMPEF